MWGILRGISKFLSWENQFFFVSFSSHLFWLQFQKIALYDSCCALLSHYVCPEYYILNLESIQLFRQAQVCLVLNGSTKSLLMFICHFLKNSGLLIPNDTVHYTEQLQYNFTSKYCVIRGVTVCNYYTTNGVGGLGQEQGQAVLFDYTGNYKLHAVTGCNLAY